MRHEPYHKPGGGTCYHGYVERGELYDFLYVNGYAAWFCNQAKQLTAGDRCLREWIMKLHTGETLAQSTPNWSWEQREKLGQRYLEDLAEDILTRLATYQCSRWRDLVSSNLELDGYRWEDERLLRPEDAVLDTHEETGVLDGLYESLALSNREIAFHHLRLSEEHYVASRWDDSISNSRKFLECVLQETANRYAALSTGSAPTKDILARPVEVRRYLERASLLEPKEREALDKVYGLLSHTGGHPYMADSDQARLLRHLSLTFSQFVMLRLEGFVKARHTP